MTTNDLPTPERVEELIGFVEDVFDEIIDCWIEWHGCSRKELGKARTDTVTCLRELQRILDGDYSLVKMRFNCKEHGATNIPCECFNSRSDP